MVRWGSRKVNDLLVLGNGLGLIIIATQLASFYFFRIDLTEENRFSIKQPTIEMLVNLDDEVYVEIYLDGDLNAGFRRLQKSIRETLEEFRVYSRNKIHYRFFDPAAAKGQNAQREFMDNLISKGIKPMVIIDTQAGRRTEKIVFPGAVLSYGGMETGVMLLRDQLGQGSQEDLNRAVEGLESELANAIYRLTNGNRKKIGFITGHGELDSLQLISLRESMLEVYDINLATRLKRNVSLQDYATLILAKPSLSFSEQEKYLLDQYLMKGGKLLILMDIMHAAMDSISEENYFSFPYKIGLDDMLFQYGVRINQDLVQDLASMSYPVVTGNLNGRPQMTPLEWPFFPLANHYADHPITRNLDATALRFVSSIDSVKATGIRKTPLVFTSSNSRRLKAPVSISVNNLRKELKPENFSSGPIPVAYLLEGKFTSLYKNRFLPEGIDSTGFKTEGMRTRLIVVSDGDLPRNDFNLRSGRPFELGFDNLTGHTYANKELIMNMVSFLTDETGLINARNKEVKMRPLNKEKIRNERAWWQAMNLVFPVALLALFGLIKVYLRKRKYERFDSAT